MSKKFVKGIVKMTLILSVIIAVVFLASAVLMIFAPKVFLSVIWYIMIGAGAVFALYLVFCLAKHIFTNIKQPKTKEQAISENI